MYEPKSFLLIYRSHNMRHRYSASSRVVNETPRDLGRNRFLVENFLKSQDKDKLS